jgi:hypothetical protein
MFNIKAPARLPHPFAPLPIQLFLFTFSACFYSIDGKKATTTTTTMAEDAVAKLFLFP